MKKFIFLLIPLLLTSCMNINEPEEDDEPIEFSLSADKTTLIEGETVKLAILLEDEKDKERANFTYVSDETILKPISFENNIITLSALSAGSTTVRVTETTYSNNKTMDFIVNSSINKTKMRQTYKDYGKNLIWANYASTPQEGNVNLLIIPVWFTDSSDYIKTNDNPLYKEYVREDIKKAYLGTNEEVGYRSVRTYYEEESGEKLKISGTVTDWYETGDSSENYKPDQSSLTRALLANAINWAENEKGINPRDYDYDEDGYIDGVVLIYARPDYNILGEIKNNFWAYCGRDTSVSPDIDYPTAGVYFWASYDFMYKNYDDYTFERTGSRYGNGNTYRQILDTETFIHEMGHMFGLYDYYDYTSFRYTPGGSYTMQDENVSTHDPFSYIALNWADPYIPTKTCTITIGDFATTHDVILLTPEWNSYDSAFDEYMLLELYSLTGLNKHYRGDWFHGIELPDGVGVRLWHVDARVVVNPYYGFSLNNITSDVYAGNHVFKLCDNSHAKIDSFPSDQRGSFICENQNMLQLISHTPDRNYGLLNRSYSANKFNNSDLFYEGSSFTMDTYKKQFINIDSGEYYTDTDTDIRLNNKKSLNWSFTVNKIKTSSDGSSTATITLTKI